MVVPAVRRLRDQRPRPVPHERTRPHAVVVAVVVAAQETMNPEEAVATMDTIATAITTIPIHRWRGAAAAVACPLSGSTTVACILTCILVSKVGDHSRG